MTAALEQGDAQLLTRYIPALRQTEDAAERVQIAQDLLGKAFGTVTAQAQTGLGPLTQAKNAFGDLQEQIGAIISEAINPFLIKAKVLFETLQAQSDETKRRFVLFASVLAGIGPAILVVAGAVKGLALVFAALSSPITLTIAGVLALSASIDYLAQNAGVFKAIFTNAWLNIKQAVLQSISDMAGGIAKFLSYVPNMQGLSNAFFAIGEQVQTSADSVEEVAVPAFQTFGEYVDSVKTRLANLATQAKNTAAAMLGIQTAEPEAVGAPEDSPILTPIVDGSEEVTESFEEIKNGIIETENAAKQYVSGMVDGFAQMVVQGQKFGDILKNIGRQLLSKGLSTVLKALLVGTTGPLAFLGGAGGTGILGRILPGIFGGAAAAPVMGASPVMDRGMLLRGEFRLDGQDLKLAVDRANQIANI
jgi:microcompartment protein CcmK/EutM